jgi:hypothetical protein
LNSVFNETGQFASPFVLSAVEAAVAVFVAFVPPLLLYLLFDRLRSDLGLASSTSFHSWMRLTRSPCLRLCGEAFLSIVYISVTLDKSWSLTTVALN